MLNFTISKFRTSLLCDEAQRMGVTGGERDGYNRRDRCPRLSEKKEKGSAVAEPFGIFRRVYRSSQGGRMTFSWVYLPARASLIRFKL